MDNTRALEKLAEQIRKSKLCPLSNFAKNAVPGEGPANAKIMLIGAAPGKMEDLTGRPFVGRAGKFLTQQLERIGLKRERLFITSVEKFFPPGNRMPNKDEVSACLPYLLEQIVLVNPKVVVLMGNLSQSIKNEPLLQDRKIIITPHPAAAMRFPKQKKLFEQKIKQLRKS